MKPLKHPLKYVYLKDTVASFLLFYHLLISHIDAVDTKENSYIKREKTKHIFAHIFLNIQLIFNLIKVFEL